MDRAEILKEGLRDVDAFLVNHYLPGELVNEIRRLLSSV